MEIGSIINKYRKEKKITLRELSEKSNVALATLCRIEKGKMSGTVKSHNDIARALDLTLADLYSGFELKSEKVELRPQQNAEIFTYNEKASYDILTKKVLAKKMMPIMLKLEKTAKTVTEKSNKGTEKFLYLIEGNIQAVIDGKTYTLKKGDSFYFDASLPHSFGNISDKPARALCVITPPAL